jgi:hypothetical protein
VINFVPVEISSFLAQISANMKVTLTLMGTSGSSSDGKERDTALDAKALMQLATEEWERREVFHKSKAKDITGTALATVASEKPGARSGGDTDDLDDDNDIVNNEDLPALESYDEGDIGEIIRRIYRLAYMEKCDELHALGIPHVIPFKSGQCRAEVEDALYFDYTDGPSAGSITVEEEVYIPDWVFAATNKGIDSQWDLYNSGASHHMSPCRGDFVNFREIPTKSLTVANSKSFVTTGTGDMIITTPHVTTFYPYRPDQFPSRRMFHLLFRFLSVWLLSPHSIFILLHVSSFFSAVRSC